jgi:hypothetical protein
MFVVVLLMLGVIVCPMVVLKAWQDKEKAVSLIFLLIGLYCLGALTFGIAPNEFGVSRVPEDGEEFKERLKEGKVYQLIASHADGADEILLVKEKDTKSYYAIRVNAMKVGLREPPYFFTLVNGGQLVEVK